MRSSICVVFPLILVGAIVVSCDSVEIVEDCVADQEPAEFREFTQLYDESTQPREVVALLHFYQDVISFSGMNCNRADSSSVTLFVDVTSLWKSISFSYSVDFFSDELVWSIDDDVVEQLPLQSVNKGIIATDPIPVNSGTFSAQLTSSVSYSEPEMPTYKVTEGACGHIVFHEHLASDLESAISIIEQRERERYFWLNLAFQRIDIDVEDQFGVVPTTDFWGIFARDADTGGSIHSLGDVVSTDGDGYWMAWCPD